MQKIMFNDAYMLTQATIEGRKTMTRRIMNPQPKDCSECHKHCWGAEWANEPMKLVYDPNMNGIYCRYCGYGVGWDGHSFLKPAYKVGEVVAVAQSYETIARQHPNVDYFLEQIAKAAGIDVSEVQQLAGYRNKMFTKAELMPHRIRITGIRAERLQDISNEDCIKEGIYKDECTTYFNGYAFELEHLEKGLVLAKRWYDTPRQAFAALIDKVSGRGTWVGNPWVVAYEYELVK